MFSFFRRKKAPEAAPPDTSEPAASVPPVAPPPAPIDTPETIASSADSAGASTVFDPESEAPEPEPALAAPEPPPAPEPVESPTRGGWLGRLKSGLRKTGGSITTVFTGTRIDEALYEELETALLLADTGVPATEHLLADLRRRVKEAKASEPAQVKALLQDAIAELLAPL
ncbi:MAG: signal recognition particle receptor subunit alpha, partial [Proteobacteria bacterium]|nr:signal recognition particle receptor subunit alpha [Pseudomonadota bacterium]